MPPAFMESSMHRYRHMAVALARTPADAGLIRYAALVARLGAATEVRFVHVLPRPADPASAHDHDRVLAQVREEVRTHFTEVPDTVQVYCDVLKGPLLDRLLAYTAEQEADLLLVGHQHSHAGQRSLARRLAMKTPCSVWMIPEGAPATLARILVPIDFSGPAADSLQVATAMARSSGLTECLALHVFFSEAPTSYEEYEVVLRGQEEEAFDRFLAPINCQGVTVRPLFEEGANVPHVIHRVADKQGADLIVMATRGRSPSAAILLGSVTEQTIIDTTVPLLVVKHFGARLGLLQALLDRNFRLRPGPRFD